MSSEANYRQISNTIWNVANHLRGSWKAHEYQDVILPLTVLKRLDAALEPTKQKVLERYNDLDGRVHDLRILRRVSGYDFYNISPFTFKKLLEDQTHLAKNLRKYIDGFSDNVKEIIKKFDFDKQLTRLEGSNVLYLILQEFEKIGLHPDHVPNHVIGLAFEDLIRRFAEQSNETAGEHYTPRDVVRLMTALIFSGEESELSKPGVVKLLYDPACGTGGMLTVAKDYIQNQFNPNVKIHLFGQELNAVTYAIAKADMLLKGENAENIKGGDNEHDKASTLSNDQHPDKKFDYILSNPPYGIEWEKDKIAVIKESQRGDSGRFGAGLPRISDGQLLFLQHIISKFKPKAEGGSNAAVIFNGSPLVTGDAGSGENKIRRWFLENDYDKAIIALPEQLFFNTGIATYIWILSNRKSPDRLNRIQLIDARSMKHPLKRNLGNKRYEITEDYIKQIVSLYANFTENEFSKVFSTSQLGYRQIVIQRPLRLRFDLNKESIGKIAGHKNISAQILTLLSEFEGKTFMDKKEFLSVVGARMTEEGIRITKKVFSTLVNELGVRDERAEICTDDNGQPEPDKLLRDTEKVPLTQDIYEYFKKEVEPYVSDAWIDESVRDPKDGEIGLVGYEIPFNHYFYKFYPPRDVPEIKKEIKNISAKLPSLFDELAKL